MGNPDDPGMLELIMDWREGRHCGPSPGEVTYAEETPLYDKLLTNGKAGGRRRKWGTFGVMTFVFPSKHDAR